MKVIKERTIKEIIEGENIHIEDLQLGAKEYSLNINNEKGQLSFDFYNRNSRSYPNDSCDYSIIIDDKGIRFERLVLRHNHDHNDVESLQIIIDSEKTEYGKNGDLIWRTRYPYLNEGYEFFYIPFGKTEVNF